MNITPSTYILSFYVYSLIMVQENRNM